MVKKHSLNEISLWNLLRLVFWASKLSVWRTWKRTVLCQCWVQWSKYVNQVKLTNGVQIFYIFMVYLSACSISFWERSVHKAPCYNDELVYSFMSVKFLVFTFGVMLLGMHKFRIIVTSLWSDPFINIKCACLSLIMTLPWKSTFSDQ